MLLVDSANPDEIRQAMALPAVRGVTTNPNLITRANGVEVMPASQYLNQCYVLCQLFKTHKWGAGNQLMLQGVGSTDQILEQAKTYTSIIAPNADTKLWIKLLPTSEALACCPAIQQQGHATLVTAVFTAAQALMAVESGADGIAVYVGRLMRFEPENWQKILEQIAHVMNEAKKLLLLASFPDLQTVETALTYSRDLTVQPIVLLQMLNSPHSEAAITDFNSKIISF